MSFYALRDRLKQLWKPQTGFDMMSVDNGYFMVKFNSMADREKMIGEDLGLYLITILL